MDDGIMPVFEQRGKKAHSGHVVQRVDYNQMCCAIAGAWRWRQENPDKI